MENITNNIVLLIQLGRAVELKINVEFMIKFIVQFMDTLLYIFGTYIFYMFSEITLQTFILFYFVLLFYYHFFFGSNDFQ